jgi:hypothetical protein
MMEGPEKEGVNHVGVLIPDAPSNTLVPMVFLDHDPAIRRLAGIPQEHHIVLQAKDVRTLFDSISAELERYGESG